MTEPDAACALLGRLAARLAGRDDPDALPAALSLLVEGLTLTGAVLRRDDASGAVLAAAGTADDGAPVHLDVAGAPHPAVLTVSGAAPDVRPVLHAAAAVLGLALSARSLPSRAAVAAVLQEADADADALADALHDGPVQALLVARYAGDSAVRQADPVAARAAVQDAVVALRHALWDVRPRGAQDLAGALQALSARRCPEQGGPLALDVDPDAADRLAPAARAAVFRLAQAACGAGARPERMSLRADGDAVVLEVVGALPGATALADRWRRRLDALGGQATVGPSCFRVVLPSDPAADPAPSDPAPPDPGPSDPAPPDPGPLLHVLTLPAPVPLPAPLAGRPTLTPEEACS